MGVLPPLYEECPPLDCVRKLDDGSYCGKPATWHIMWDSDLENSTACDEHMAEVRNQWCFFAAHPHEWPCTMPGRMYDHEHNRCFVDETLVGLEAADTIAVPIEA